MSDYASLMENWRLAEAGAAGILLIDATVVDGSAAAVALPNWQHLQFANIAGTNATINANGDMVFAPAVQGIAVNIEWRLNILQNYGKNVFLGHAWNGSPSVISSQAYQVNSNTPIFIIHRLSGPINSVLAIYISSDFQYSPTQWSGGEMMFMAANAAAPQGEP